VPIRTARAATFAIDDAICIAEVLKCLFPSFEEGALRHQEMQRYLKIGAAREVRTFLQQWFDLPGRADFKVASPLLDRRGRPSSKEGNIRAL